jgi:hypothetical protein
VTRIEVDPVRPGLPDLRGLLARDVYTGNFAARSGFQRGQSIEP